MFIKIIVVNIVLASMPFFLTAGNGPENSKSLLDKDWRFILEDKLDSENQDALFSLKDKSFKKAGMQIGITSNNFQDTTWRPVDVPHDWAVELDFVNDRSLASHGYKPVGPKFPENSIGWYRKKFFISKEDNEKRISIKFDGVFRNCEVWLNGFSLGNNTSGYMDFEFDVTDFINYGGNNALVVRVDASRYEGWWYEGAGIYRHVWLIKNDQTYIPENGIYIKTEINNDVTWVDVQTRLVNKAIVSKKCQLLLKVRDKGGDIIKTSESLPVSLDDNTEKIVTERLKISQPNLWSVENPYLYSLVAILKCNNEVIHETEIKFGVREVKFDANKGFLLNGKPLKIKGACIHQDHAGVGVALPDRLQYYRIEKLKEMGCNAYRTSHNPPTPELLDACDQLGMLVMDETRLLSSSQEYISQFERLILRDRNHPSVIIWSLGNEEMNIQDTEAGKRVAQTLKSVQKKLDPSRLCTYGGNNRGNYYGTNEIVDVRGVNYFGRRYKNIRTNDIDQYHSEHPDQPMWGSEEASTLCTRGVYTVSEPEGYMSDYDKRENTVFPWCTNAEEWWKYIHAREWMAGAFIWTGFDYRGETGPHNWPTINSHFGVMDICGFPKNNYYYYKSWWTKEDVLHIYPHWNWSGKIGDTINVWCQTNCEEVELYLNGKSLGRKKMEKDSHLEWDVIYQPGTLEAKGIKDGKTLVKKIETTGETAKLIFTPVREVINADGEDISILNITAIDSKGREVPDADNFIVFKIKGNGKIIGIGNGDPSSHEPDKILTGDYYRKLFMGKCQVIIQGTKDAGEIEIEAESRGLKAVKCKLTTVAAPIRLYTY